MTLEVVVSWMAERTVKAVVVRVAAMAGATVAAKLVEVGRTRIDNPCNRT